MIIEQFILQCLPKGGRNYYMQLCFEAIEPVWEDQGNTKGTYTLVFLFSVCFSAIKIVCLYTTFFFKSVNCSVVIFNSKCDFLLCFKAIVLMSLFYVMNFQDTHSPCEGQS